MNYQSGFGNQFASEALAGALPTGQNSPQRVPYGLYAEQISGSAFTAPNAENRRSWFYRVRPSVQHFGNPKATAFPHWLSSPSRESFAEVLAPLRWGPAPKPTGDIDFLDGVRTMTTAGDVHTRTGMAAHVFHCDKPMADRYFYNADAEMLVVPHRGRLRFETECGGLEVGVKEIAVLPRGMKFSVSPLDGDAAGFICENFGLPFVLPERGPIGANCLANPRDFLYPVAAYQDTDQACQLVVKWSGRFFASALDHSPLDVVAWHGNYAPYKYDLTTFSPVGAILFDHPDPSIFTVLTAPSELPGTANVDFVIFPERWLVAENTFRPPWYHMNVMSEFMGLLHGVYDAKPDGFVAGGMSLHNSFVPHGPDSSAFMQATNADLKPVKLEETLAFMFECRLPQHLTEYAASLETKDNSYAECWADLPRRFDANQP
ncbi:MAG: homogentisate 1,2-dioxygenase [Pseudomonadota bacterium]